MNEQDRTSIHEAMEQQTISVSKAGIVTSLQARCSVMAAANPIGGRYDPSYTFAENVELTDPILQRFDVLCVLQDIVDPVTDEKLASFVVNSHMRSHPEGPTVDVDAADGPIGEAIDHEDAPDPYSEADKNLGSAYLDEGPAPIDQAMLKKYITYARAYHTPVLQEINREKVASLYADMRQHSISSGGVPIAVRHIESVMRMSEAFARMHLRDFVRDDDVDRAIKVYFIVNSTHKLKICANDYLQVMLESFLQAQKVSVRKTLQRNFRKYITFGEENNQLLMHQLQGLIRDAEKYQQLLGPTRGTASSIEVYISDLKTKAKELNIHDLTPFFNSSLFRNHGLTVDESRGVIVWVQH